MKPLLGKTRNELIRVLKENVDILLRRSRLIRPVGDPLRRSDNRQAALRNNNVPVSDLVEMADHHIKDPSLNRHHGSGCRSYGNVDAPAGGNFGGPCARGVNNEVRRDGAFPSIHRILHPDTGNAAVSSGDFDHRCERVDSGAVVFRRGEKLQRKTPRVQGSVGNDHPLTHARGNPRLQPARLLPGDPARWNTGLLTGLHEGRLERFVFLGQSYEQAVVGLYGFRSDPAQDRGLLHAFPGNLTITDGVARAGMQLSVMPPGGA